MRFATLRLEDGPTTVLVRDGRFVDLGRVAANLYKGFPSHAMPAGRAFVDAYGSGNPLLRQVAREAAKTKLDDLPLLELDEPEFLAPVFDPRMVLALGLNYRDHCEEQNVSPPGHPLFFAKLPSCLTGHKKPIVKWELTEKLDYEAELAVVVGRRCRRVRKEDALSCVFGYTILNDVSARDLQRADRQWGRSKSLDSFGPMGPVVVTRDEILNPQKLSIRTFVNDELRQDSSTENMLFGVAEVISFVSQAITLEPGDVIATGTPAGVGLFMDPPRFLEVGDVVRIEIEGIGELENTVQAPE